MERILRFLARPWTFAFTCAAIIALWIGWAFIVRAMIPNSWDNRGLSGDMYGSLNTLFTGLAFAGLLYTIALQRIALADDEKDKKRQRFEANFFQLLRSVEAIIDAVDVRTGTKADPINLRGRDCFTKFFNDWEGYLQSSKYSSATGIDRVRLAYEDFYSRYQTDLGHYYRSMYHVFKYISLSCPENKEFYAHLVRAQLSSQQLLLLFYNCMSSYGDGFKKYVDEFALLKHMPRALIKDQALLAFYDATAYGSNG